MKYCQNSFQAFGFHFSFFCQKVQSLSNILLQISNFASFFSIRNKVIVIICTFQRILRPKMTLLVCQKVQIWKFRKILSKINIFVTTDSSRHFVSFSPKQNFLKPKDQRHVGTE